MVPFYHEAELSLTRPTSRENHI